MKCTNCGKVNTNDSIFCVSCGKPIGAGNHDADRYNFDYGKSAMKKLNTAYNYFSRRDDLYESVYRLSSTINTPALKCKIFRIIYCSVFLYRSITVILSDFISIGVLESLNSNFGYIFIILVLDFVFGYMLFSHLSRVRRNKRKIKAAKALYLTVSRELYDYYMAYDNCPVSIEYSDPSVLYKLCCIAQEGRAYTVSDAVRVYNEDCYRIGMDNSRNELALRSVFSMYNN